MEIDGRILDELIDFIEANKGLKFKYPSVRAGVYRGYNIRVTIEDPVEEEEKK